VIRSSWLRTSFDLFGRIHAPVLSKLKIIKLLDSFVAVDTDLHKVIECRVEVFGLHADQRMLSKLDDPFHVSCKIQHWLISCRPGAKIGYVLQMLHVPSKRVDLRLYFIDGDVCLLIFFMVAVVFDFTGKLIDALDVV